mmetsp:Transcript_140870/g.450376  ORF Transcript_140870/g.450376 Transcript_140870/m.450376 type:complete len:531 (-) Transcript_140870:241-1833(-)
MGGVASGAMDANAFKASLRGARLPAASSITYQGVFNEHSYSTGLAETEHVVALQSVAGRVQCAAGAAEQSDLWVGCFLKSCRDGQPRDEVPIDIIVVLDISGSMSGSVGVGSSAIRLDLAKQALLRLLPMLRDGDRFGLATFTTEGEVVQPLNTVTDLDHEGLSQRISALRAGGGTTLAAGLDAAVAICKGTADPSGRRHKRLLFLTDMEDLTPGALDNMVEQEAEQGRFVSFVGIGMGFNAKLAEEVTKHPGSNYFCITREQELQKVIVDNFDWNFFPAAFGVEVTQQSDSFELAAVYGTPFDTREETLQADWLPSMHKFYPADFKLQAKALALCVQRSFGIGLPMPAMQNVLGFLSSGVSTVTRVDTVFPSGVHADGSVEGGLILFRMKPKAGGTAVGATNGMVRLTLRYTAGGEEFTRCEDIQVPSPGDALGRLDPALKKGVMLQRYVQACRQYLLAADAGDSADQLKAALACVTELRAEFEAEPDATEALCPGVLVDLKDFAEMVHKHAMAVEAIADDTEKPRSGK